MLNVDYIEDLKKKRFGTFIKELLLMYWPRNTLINRCIKLQQTSISIQGRSPRNVLTPKRFKQFRGHPFFLSLCQTMNFLIFLILTTKFFLEFVKKSTLSKIMKTQQYVKL